MRTLWMVVVVLLVGELGCTPRRVAVADTPEGKSCRRECMQIYTSCMAGRRPTKRECRLQENECLRTCPGVTDNVVVSSPEEEAPRPVLAPGARCIASELPEWQGASAAEKKQLMEQCRGPAEQ